MIFFLLAQGRQRRLRSLGYPKQLVSINGEPLLGNTIRRIKTFTDAKIVVVADDTDTWKDFASEHSVELLTLRPPGTCVVAGIYNLWPRWAPDTVFALGDVVWSVDGLKALLSPQRRPVRIVGQSKVDGVSGELFALRSISRRALAGFIAHRCDDWGVYQCGHLRVPLFNRLGFTINESTLERINDIDYSVEYIVDDKSWDIDDEFDVVRAEKLNG